MGFGRPLDSYSPNGRSTSSASSAPPLAGIAEAAGRPVDDWSCTGEVAAARHGRPRSWPASCRGARSARSATSCRGAAAAARSCASPSTWYCTTELEPALGRPADRMAGAGATATRPSTSSCRSPSRSTTSPTTRPRTPRTDRSTRSRTSARRAPGVPRDRRPAPDHACRPVRYRDRLTLPKTSRRTESPCCATTCKPISVDDHVVEPRERLRRSHRAAVPRSRAAHRRPRRRRGLALGGPLLPAAVPGQRARRASSARAKPDAATTSTRAATRT